MTAPTVHWISAEDPPDAFPAVDAAFSEPEGLLAAGGDLSRDRLLYAYRHGIFPWFNEGQPILWWSPDPRCILRPSAFHVSRSLRRSLRRSGFEFGFNESFADVIQACGDDRPGQQGTWITAEMTEAYVSLHREGWAHSVEIWADGKLVGGMYGLAIGRAFFGESMFSRQSDASKAAMLALCRHLAAHDFALLDCQVESPHLASLGAELMPRSTFIAILDEACAGSERFTSWPDARQPLVADALQ